MAVTPSSPFGCTQDDLADFLGGASVLNELADRDGDGVADEAVVQALLDDGAAMLLSYAEVKHDAETFAALSAASVRRSKLANAGFSAGLAWERGSRGQAMPEVTQRAVDRERQYAEDLKTGAQRLGRATGAAAIAINQTAGVMNYDALAEKMSIAGLKRGFR